MAYKITFRPAARKEFLALDKPLRSRIGAAVDALAGDPRPSGAAPIKGRPGYLRIRIGTYRVIYTIEDDRLIVTVVRLGHRREVYRGNRL